MNNKKYRLTYHNGHTHLDGTIFSTVHNDRSFITDDDIEKALQSKQKKKPKKISTNKQTQTAHLKQKKRKNQGRNKIELSSMQHSQAITSTGHIRILSPTQMQKKGLKTYLLSI